MHTEREGGAMLLEQWKSAMSMIPAVTDQDVDLALAAAHLKLGKRQRGRLRDRLTVTLHNYVVERLLHAQSIAPSKIKPRLDRLVRSADALLAALRVDADDRIAMETRKVLSRHTIPYADRLTVLGPPNPTTTKADDHLARIANVVAVLRAVAKDARARAQHQITRKGKGTAAGKSRERRHVGDQALQSFFGDLNGIWMDCFDRLPSATWDAHGGSLKGAYIKFAESVLHSYAAKIPDKLEQGAPGLRARLRLSRQAIHGRFRRTRISKVRGIAKSVSRSN